MIHINHLIRVSTCRLDAHPDEQRGGHESGAAQARATRQAFEERAARDEQERISRKKIPDADVDPAQHDERRVDEEREQHEEESPIALRQQFADSPCEGGEREEQKGERRLEGEGDGKVVPPAGAAVHAEKRRGMAASVVLKLPENAEHEVCRQQVGEGARGVRDQRCVRREGFGQPTRVCIEERATIEEVGRIDDEEQRDGDDRAVRDERRAQRARRTPQQHREQHDEYGQGEQHRELGDNRHARRKAECGGALPVWRARISIKRIAKQQVAERRRNIRLYYATVREHRRLKTVEGDRQRGGARAKEPTRENEDEHAERARERDHGHARPERNSLEAAAIVLPETYLTRPLLFRRKRRRRRAGLRAPG